MTYQILNEKNIRDYLLTQPTLCQKLGGDDLEIQEIGDGNINYVYIIKSKASSENALIIKQAVPYLRCIGESYNLSRERMNYETASLKTLHALTPQHVPEIYHVDEQMSLVVMQYLGNHTIMRKGLIQGMRYPLFAEHISTFLAETLFKTSSLHLSSPEKRMQMQKFNNNTELCALTENFVFTYAYMEHETNHQFSAIEKEAAQLRQDSVFKNNVLDLKYKFMTQADALLHGDLHTGSIMINQQETFVIDPEFAFFGPFGFDIGAIMANLLLSYCSHRAQSSDPSYLNWLLNTISQLITLFREKFLSLWRAQHESALIKPGYFTEENMENFRQQFVDRIISDSVGFAGCKMARRILGLAGVADIRGIQDPQLRYQAEKNALTIAKNFVTHYKHCHNATHVINLISESYE